MYARVTTFPGTRNGAHQATPQEFTGHHVPKLEQQPGYRGVGRGSTTPAVARSL